MGMFDNITCEYPLPDGFDAEGIRFQTKDLENLMDSYTITRDGKLILHRVRYESVPEEEMPFYGTPEWEKGGLARIFGMLKSVPEGDEYIQFHGDIEFYYSNVVAVSSDGYATAEDAPLIDKEYTARFTEGEVAWIQGGDASRDGHHLTRAELARLNEERRVQREKSGEVGGSIPMVLTPEALPFFTEGASRKEDVDSSTTGEDTA